MYARIEASVCQNLTFLCITEEGYWKIVGKNKYFICISNEFDCIIGVLFSLIEGVGILHTRLSADQFENPLLPPVDPAVLEDPTHNNSNSSA